MDDGDQPEGRIAVHRGGVAVQLESQVFTRLHPQGSVVGDPELLSGIGPEPEGRVVHGLGIHGSDSDGLLTDVPFGRRHRASDDTGVRLGDVLHGGRTLELRGTVDRFRDLGRRRRARRCGASHQDETDHREDEEQHRGRDAVRRDPRLAVVGAAVARVSHIISQ